MKAKHFSLILGIIIGIGIVLIFNTLNIPPDQGFEDLPEPYYKILFQNDNVRIVEHRLNPGETEPMHNHPPMYVYFLEEAEVVVTGPGGKSQIENLRKGQSLKISSLSHSIENQGSSPLHSILIELKE